MVWPAALRTMDDLRSTGCRQGTHAFVKMRISTYIGLWPRCCSKLIDTNAATTILVLAAAAASVEDFPSPCYNVEKQSVAPSINNYVLLL